MGQRAKQRLIQAFIAQSADEALNKRILLRLARCDVVPVDTSRVRPVQDCLAGQFGSVIGNAALGLAPPRDQCVKLSCYADARQRGVRDQRQALTREVVDDR